MDAGLIDILMQMRRIRSKQAFQNTERIAAAVVDPRSFHTIMFLRPDFLLIFHGAQTAKVTFQIEIAHGAGGVIGLVVHLSFCQ